MKVGVKCCIEGCDEETGGKLVDTAVGLAVGSAIGLAVGSAIGLALGAAEELAAGGIGEVEGANGLADG